MKTTYEELSEQRRWIAVDDRKRPLGKWKDESLWRTRDQIDGRAGYVIPDNHYITIIDFDECVEGNEIVDNAEGDIRQKRLRHGWECFRTVRSIDLFQDEDYMPSFRALYPPM